MFEFLVYFLAILVNVPFVDMVDPNVLAIGFISGMAVASLANKIINSK